MPNADAALAGLPLPTALHEIRDREAHVWTIPLSLRSPTAADWATLSADETERARRFHFDHHREQFVLSHSALRQIIAEYATIPATQLEFVTGVAGKPALAPSMNARQTQFNLSHSGDFALVAVARERPIGVDIERWDDRVEFLQLADHYFSPRERASLRALENEPQGVMQGFFRAWSRKEAYLKATGLGITQGLHHFDVALTPGEPAALLADRSDARAVHQWSMSDLAVPDGYSAAVVIAGLSHEIIRAHFVWP